jgi:Double zinc ribbon
MGPTAERDWYAYLRLSPDAPADEIERAVERLSRQASALAATAPERSQQLRETVRAMKRDLLSGPEARHRYDERVRQAGSPASIPHQTIPQQATPPRGRHAAPGPPQATPPQAAFPQATPPQAAVPQPAPPDFTLPMSMRRGDGAGARLVRFLRTGWTCPSCGKGGVPSDKFCTRCGTPIRPTQDSAAGPDRVPRPRFICQNCANPLGPSGVFCSKCGTRR